MSDFKLVNIVDSQLEDIASELTLPVISGSSSNNYQTFNSQASTGTGQMQFNIQIPSLQTAVSRHFLVQSEVTLKINFATGPWSADQVLFNYGYSNSLQAFPLNSLFNTLQSNINNATVSVNTRDVLAGLLKMYNYRELAQYNSLTPSLPDSFYLNYADGLGSNNNVLSNYSNGGFDKKFQPRGVYPVKLYDSNMAEMNSLQVKADGNGTAPAFVYLKFTTTEPLLFLSPYISAHSNNQSAFLGLNNLTITANMGDATRCMSNGSYADKSGVSTATISSVDYVSYTGAKLLLNFLTIPPVMFSKIEPKNVVNYNQYTSFNYSSGQSIPAKSTSTVAFNNIQLNQIPSRMLIFARKSQMTTYDSNSFMCIKSVSINFGNKSGLLSSCNSIQLYDMSVRNSLQMNYYEYSGAGISNDTQGVPKNMSTIGSILSIDPAIDLSIDSQYSNSSGGQFNMQFDLQLFNQGDEEITPTLYLVVVNSGIFVTENGASSFLTGLLNQEMVLETKTHDAITDTHSYDKKMVGGSIENIAGVHKHLKQAFSKASEKEKIIDKEGSGMSAGNLSSDIQGAKRRIHKYIAK